MRSLKPTELVTLFAVPLCVGIVAVAVYQWSRDPVLEQRARDGYQHVSTSRDPLIMELFRGQIALGTPVNSVVARIAPHKTNKIGRYSIYEFSDNSYDWKTLIARDNRVVYAGVGSCTFDWTFFDSVEGEAYDAISRISWLRRYIADHPELEPNVRSALESVLQTQLKALEEI